MSSEHNTQLAEPVAEVVVDTTPAETPDDVELKDTVSVDEIEGTKRAVEQDLANKLLEDAPGGEYGRMDERAQMRHITTTRTRQIKNWMATNFNPADRLLDETMQQLRDLFTNIITNHTPEEFQAHAISKLFVGDAILLEWKNNGINLVDIKLSFNPSTGYPVIHKQNVIFGKSIAFKHPAIDKLLKDAGINLNVDLPRDPTTNAPLPTNAKSIIFSVGQCVEIYNVRISTILSFKSVPSTELALRPLDILHTFNPMGFNAMLKTMSERKLVAMGRREWADWQKASADPTKPILDVTQNPLYAKGRGQGYDDVQVTAIADGDTPW